MTATTETKQIALLTGQVITSEELSYIKEGWEVQIALNNAKYRHRHVVHKIYENKPNGVNYKTFQPVTACGKDSADVTEEGRFYRKAHTDWNMVTCKKCLEVQIGLKAKQVPPPRLTAKERNERRDKKREAAKRAELRKQRRVVKQAKVEAFDLKDFIL